MGKTKFETLLNYIKRSQNRLCLAQSHFEIWKVFKKSLAPNLNKKQAEKNVKLFERYGSFITLTINSHLKIVIIELSKFFDQNNKALGIKKILNFTKSNLKYLSIDDFKSHNTKRRHLQSILKNYEGIKQSDLKFCEEELNKIGFDISKPKNESISKNSAIHKIMKIRNKEIAHDEINEKYNTFEINEIEQIFITLEKVLNLLSYKLNHEKTLPITYKNEPKLHTKQLIKDLNKYKKIKKNQDKRILKSLYKNHQNTTDKQNKKTQEGS